MKHLPFFLICGLLVQGSRLAAEAVAPPPPAPAPVPAAEAPLAPVTPPAPAADAVKSPLELVGPLPTSRKAHTIPTGERNPFADVAKKAATPQSDSESEEFKLREALKALPITGVINRNGTRKVLMGDLTLWEGKELDPLIREQTDVLVVTRVDDAAVEISWQEETPPGVQPRKYLKPIKLRPTVRSVRPGQSEGSDLVERELVQKARRAGENAAQQPSGRSGPDSVIPTEPAAERGAAKR